MKDKQSNTYIIDDIKVKNISKFFGIFLLISVVIGVISCIIVSNKIKNIDLTTNDNMYKKLASNCNEKYFNIKINYDDIIKEYIDKIYSLVNKKDFQYLYLNLDESYIDKTNITVEQMTSKLEEISKNGKYLNSYEKHTLDDIQVYVCKLGVNDSLLTIYEHKPGIYSFAFDGFVE